MSCAFHKCHLLVICIQMQTTSKRYMHFTNSQCLCTSHQITEASSSNAPVLGSVLGPLWLSQGCYPFFPFLSFWVANTRLNHFGPNRLSRTVARLIMTFAIPEPPKRSLKNAKLNISYKSIICSYSKFICTSTYATNLNSVNLSKVGPTQQRKGRRPPPKSALQRRNAGPPPRGGCWSASLGGSVGWDNLR